MTDQPGPGERFVLGVADQRVYSRDNFARNMKALLGAHGLTGKDASALTGVSANTLSGWLTGQRDPSLTSMERIATFFEVYPGGFVRRHGLDKEKVPGGRLASIVTALTRLPRLPVDVDAPWRSKCLSQRDALDALLAARCAAGAVLSGEIDREPAELAPENAEQVKTEGWIYGLDL